VLYLLSREDHLLAKKLTGHGFDFLYRMKYCRFYTDDRRKKKFIEKNLPHRNQQIPVLDEI
jgi:hypothetical protein